MVRDLRKPLISLGFRLPAASNLCTDLVVFAALAHEVRNLRIPLHGPALTEAIAIRGQLDAAITTAAGEFDAAELWDIDAATSMHAWLREHAGMTSRQAACTVSVSRRLASMPVTAGAWARRLAHQRPGRRHRRQRPQAARRAVRRTGS